MSWKPNIGIRCKDTLIFGLLQKVSAWVFIELFSKNAFGYFLFVSKCKSAQRPCLEGSLVPWQVDKLETCRDKCKPSCKDA